MCQLFRIVNKLNEVICKVIQNRVTLIPYLMDLLEIDVKQCNN